MVDFQPLVYWILKKLLTHPFPLLYSREDTFHLNTEMFPYCQILQQPISWQLIKDLFWWYHIHDNSIVHQRNFMMRSSINYILLLFDYATFVHHRKFFGHPYSSPKGSDNTVIGLPPCYCLHTQSVSGHCSRILWLQFKEAQTRRWNCWRVIY